jgi:hypothetical protein
MEESSTGIDVTTWVFLSNKFNAFDLNVRNNIRVDISVNLEQTPDEPYVISAIIPFSLTNVTDLPEGGSYSFGFWGYPPIGVLRLDIPANVTGSIARLWGYMSGSSFLWRNVCEIQISNVTSTLKEIPNYRINTVASTSKLVRVYSSINPDLDYDEVIVDGSMRVTISEAFPRTPVVVLYESPLREPGMIGVMCIVLVAVFLCYYLLKSHRLRKIWFVGIHKC